MFILVFIMSRLIRLVTTALVTTDDTEENLKLLVNNKRKFAQVALSAVYK